VPGAGEAVKLAIKIAAVAGGALTALAISGGGAHATGVAGAAGGASQGTVRACAAYGVHAIEHHITLTRKPAPCRGLSPAQVNQAVAIAVARFTGSVPKALRRKREAEAEPYLYRLVTPPPHAAGAPPITPSVSRTGRDLPMSIAALIAWLVTAGSGAYMLGSWIAHGGTLRRRPDSISTGSPPVVVFGHFGLALSGLAVWVAYLVAGSAPLAWVAVAVLLPVAGLGMATLAVGLPGRLRPAAGDDPADAADLGTGDQVDLRTGDQVDLGTASKATAGAATQADGGATPPAVIAGDVRAGRAGTHGARGASARTGLPPPAVFVGHGVLAVTTMILVLLAALGAAAN
jgi:manganese efflux pump family protein